MKFSLIILFTLLAASSLTGCNTLQKTHIAFACEQGIKNLGEHLHTRSHAVQQASLSRANSLLVAAQVQHQFAEYASCVDKVKRAQDYLSGRQTAIISRL